MTAPYRIDVHHHILPPEYVSAPPEFAALLATPPALWNEAADEIDPRLQNTNLAD